VRILIADDDRVLSHLLCNRLRAYGCDVVPAFDAMQAFMYALRTPQPDAIVLDVNMPAGTGVETLKKLKLSSKTTFIPVIVLSGSTDPRLPESVAELGAAQFLAKPIDPESLFGALAALLAVGRAG
jgi:DNA-binding response OmpR family regulator